MDNPFNLLANIVQPLVDYFHSPIWQRWLLIFKSISAMLCLVLLACIFMVVFRFRYNLAKRMEGMTTSLRAPDLPKKRIVKKWQSILKKLEAGDENSLKLAVIEADKMFDDLLKKIGYPGEDMGQRLKKITSAQLTNIQEIWQAHKLRNRLVHEPDFRLNRAQAERVIEIYQRAMEELEAI